MPPQPIVYDVSQHKPRPSDTAALKNAILEKLIYAVGKDPLVARQGDWLTATILAVRDRIIDSWMESSRQAWRTSQKRVYYLSLEFLIGRLLRDAVYNLELEGAVKDALAEFNVDFDALVETEPDAALGNGGLGRLAACFLESMSTVEIPAYGYGIRYVHGLFRQEISEGWQVELPEEWLAHGNPWEFERRESAYEIGFGGQVETVIEPDGRERSVWQPAEHLLAVAFDTPVVGWKGKKVNTLRLWSAQPIDPILLDRFNSGDHIGALEESAKAGAITRVLYPVDSNPAGQELRLRQEFFFSSASLQDIVRRHMQQYGDLGSLPDKVAIQLNDTHPAISVAELMRILMDVQGLGFEEAWRLTRGTFSYTNHTLLPEALESWPVGLLERLLPRQMQLCYAINARVLAEAREKGFDGAQIADISLIDEHNGRRLRMGQLAFVGSHSVNGVSALHTDLMKQTVFAQLHRLYPERINNKTNGVTPRRWLMQCNPGLTDLIAEQIGPGFKDDIEAIAALDGFAGDSGFQARFAQVKRANKVRLARTIRERTGVLVSPDAMFDIQIKRIHEYKRQLLNVMEAVALYNRMRMHPERDWAPRVKIFAGKAAPSYWNAKLIIKLINDVARVINSDPAVRGLLKVVFLPNYNVSLAETIIPAADLSEQISTAGMEASGTGNMKFALNGALTIGTLDGANVEMRDHVGDDNILIFGLTAEEVEARRSGEGPTPREAIEASPLLRDVLDAISGGVFSPDDRGRYQGLVDGLYEHDWFMVARDFDSYYAAQREADGVWKDRARWTGMAIHNTARMAWFSSDRTIREYASDIWRVETTN